MQYCWWWIPSYKEDISFHTEKKVLFQNFKHSWTILCTHSEGHGILLKNDYRGDILSLNHCCDAILLSQQSKIFCDSQKLLNLFSDRYQWLHYWYPSTSDSLRSINDEIQWQCLKYDIVYAYRTLNIRQFSARVWLNGPKWVIKFIISTPRTITMCVGKYFLTVQTEHSMWNAVHLFSKMSRVFVMVEWSTRICILMCNQALNFVFHHRGLVVENQK